LFQKKFKRKNYTTMTQLSYLEGWSMSLHRIQRREKLVSHMGQ
jgi:hypothetical protein